MSATSTDCGPVSVTCARCGSTPDVDVWGGYAGTCFRCPECDARGDVVELPDRVIRRGPIFEVVG